MHDVINNRDEKKLIVSITSYPARIHHVHNVLSAIYAQTMKPYDMVLYLAQEQFPIDESVYLGMEPALS